MVNYDSYQKECLNVMLNTNCGQIILPTGTGKSKIEFEWAKSKLISKDGIHQIVLITAPTILLCQQLLSNCYNFFMKKEKDVPEEYFTFVSSGNVPSINTPAGPIFGVEIGVNTTKVKDIAHAVRVAEKLNSDNIFFSTYKSFDRCVLGVIKGLEYIHNPFEVHLIADEAHYFAGSLSDKSEFKPFSVLSEHLNLFTTRFFFTATPRVFPPEDGNPSSMDNENIYGSIVYEKPPKYFIEKGIICEPRLHRAEIYGGITEENFNEHMSGVLINIFLAHEQIINEHAHAPEKQGAKVLVAVEGSRQLKQILDSNFCARAKKLGIAVGWTMTNKDVGTFYDGQPVSTDDLLSKIRSHCYKEDGSTNFSSRLIIFHYDRLTEGVDVPSMTGLVVLREMNKTKKIQNIGRILRTNKEDHTKEYEDRKETWTKPYAYVIVPDFGGASRFDALMEQLVNEYGASQEICSSANIAIGLGEEQPEMQNNTSEPKKFKSVSHEILHQIESFERWEKRIIRQLELGEEVDISFREDRFSDELQSS